MAFKSKADVVSESVIFNGKKYNRYPNAKQQAHQRYYMRGGGHHLLHRDIWEFHNGPIPPQMQIHHVDHDFSNNDITNLALVSCKQHMEEHKEERMALYNSEAQKEHLTRIREKAAEWHRSPEGREWHRGHAYNSIRKAGSAKAFSKAKLVDKTCTICNNIYQTKNPLRSMFCSNKCMWAKYREPKKAQLKYFTCLQCGTGYSQKIYMGGKHLCSQKCKNDFWRNKRKEEKSIKESTAGV